MVRIRRYKLFSCKIQNRKMNWKEFFKPTIWKITLFLILLILFVPFIQYDNGIRCNRLPCPTDTTGSAAMWLLVKTRTTAKIYDFNYLYFAIGSIISYAISCLIISLKLIFSRIFNNLGLFMKDFLRITKSKSVLFILLLLLFAFVFSLKIKTLAFIMIFRIVPFWDLPLPFLIFIGVFYLYLLSCLVDYIWGKIKS